MKIELKPIQPPLLRRNISAQIATLVRKRILNGAYPGGAQLLQDSVAAEFGVSKIPVREALVQLSAEGLVDIHANRGFQVRSMSIDEAEEVFGIRLMIEPAVCAEGARRARHEDRVEADAALDVLVRQLSTRKMEEAGEANLNFHLSLTVPRLQPIATEIVSRLLTISHRYSYRHFVAPGRAASAIGEHVKILRVWKTGSAKDVERMTRLHIEAARDDLMGLLKAKS
jgi:DNA-binding GntR family transcriptional regulator